jgi:hypothetical protein
MKGMRITLHASQTTALDGRVVNFTIRPLYLRVKNRHFPSDGRREVWWALGKVKVVPVPKHHAIKPYRKSGGTVPQILDIGRLLFCALKFINTTNDRTEPLRL